MNSTEIIFREAVLTDIPGIQRVRNVVKENRLSNPALVTDHDCEEFLFQRGKGWVALSDNMVVGFSIADMKDDNVWALFVDPEFEKKGIGKELQRLMLDWYFAKGKTSIWLGTAPGTRAEQFYHNTGWVRDGMHGSKEVKFLMTKEGWIATRDC